jgi:hypothetical protein
MSSAIYSRVTGVKTFIARLHTEMLYRGAKRRHLFSHKRRSNKLFVFPLACPFQLFLSVEPFPGVEVYCRVYKYANIVVHRS